MAKNSNVIACLLCPKEADGYYPEFVGLRAHQAFAAHLAEVHGLDPAAPVARELVLHLTMDKLYQSNYNLFEQTPEGRGRRVGALCVEVMRGKGGR